MRHLSIYSAIRTVVQLGSIRRAAEVLAISPSALNRQILALEDELGVALFDRLPAGVRLSTAGEIYFRQFQQHMSGMERARSRVADLAGLRLGRVGVALEPGQLDTFLHRQVARYRAEFSAVSFRVRPPVPPAAAGSPAVEPDDLALAILPPTSDELHTILAADLPLVAIGRSAAGSPLRLHDLLEHDLILPPAETGLRRHLERTFRRRHAPLRAAVEAWATDLAGLTGPEPALQLMLACDVEHTALRAVGLQVMAVDPRDLPPAPALLAQYRDRTLSVAAAKFADQISVALVAEASA